MNVFFGGGAPLPFLKALRCCGGAALLLRKEWRAAGARISLVVRRRCCPSSALELKKRRAANACEAGPRRLAMSPHLWMGGPHVFFMGDVAGGSAIVPRREGGPAHPILRLRAEGLPTLLYRSILGERMQQGGVCEGYPRHASGRRGRRSLHSYARLALKSWHEPAGAAAIPT